jgi:hypothetical protein
MWIFTNRAFLSIVRHSDKPNILIVRSRFPGHVESVFPRANVTEDTGTDYRYRAELNSKEVSRVIARLVSQIDYPNFKDSLSDETYLNCCFDVYWAVLKHSGNWDFSQFDYLGEESNEA